MSRSESPSVVVGYDGSAGANRALEWAADDAARRRVPLRIVHVVVPWPYDIAKFSTGGGPEVVGAGRLPRSGRVARPRRRRRSVEPGRDGLGRQRHLHRRPGRPVASGPGWVAARLRRVVGLGRAGEEGGIVPVPRSRAGGQAPRRAVPRDVAVPLRRLVDGDAVLAAGPWSATPPRGGACGTRVTVRFGLPPRVGVPPLVDLPAGNPVIRKVVSVIHGQAP